MHALKKAVKGKGWGPTGSGPPPTDDLTPITRDALFLYQLQTPNPTALTEESLLTAKICETKQYAHSVFSSLTKTGVIVASTGNPDNTRINKDLVSKIGIIPVPKQRELVNMLFFWEEELTRWRVLDEEARGLEETLSADAKGEDLEALRERLRVIEAMKRVVPSQRRQDGSLKNQEGSPPEYAP